MEAIFLKIYNFFSKNKIIYWSLLVLIAIPIFFFASKIRMEEDITKILPGSGDGDEYQEVLTHSAIMEKLVVRISLNDTNQVDADRLTTYASDFIEKLETNKENKNLIKEVRHRLPDEVMLKAYNLFYNNLPFFLEDQDYKTLENAIVDSNVAKSLQKNYNTLMSPISMMVKQQVTSDPLHFTTLVLSKLQTLQINKEYELYDGYIVSRNRKSLLLLITPSNPPSETSQNGKLIDNINSLINKLKTEEYKDIHTEYFGSSAMAVANSKQIQKDVWLTVSISLLCICLLLWGYFRKVSLPIIILFPIVFGVGFALALIYLFKQYISSVAVGGGAVIIGIAVNYSLHSFTHYKHTRSIPTVIKDLSTPLLIGNISTVLAFFSLLFVKSEILFDFGLFSGLSLAGAIIFTLIFFPPLLAYYKIPEHLKQENRFEKIILKYLPSGKLLTRMSIFLIFGLSIFFFSTFKQVKFENDLNALNFMSPELRDAEKHINIEEKESDKNIYLLFKGKNLDDAISQNEKTLIKIKGLIKDSTVSKYFGVTSLIISDSLQKIRKQRWENFWTDDKKEKLKTIFSQEAPKYGFKINAFDSFFELLDKKFTKISDDEIRDVKQYFLKDYISSSKNLTIIMACLKVPPANTEKVYKSISSSKGTYILDKQYIIRKFIEIVKADFNQILYTSSLLVFLILWIFYARIELALITFLPMLISWLWILGVMSIFDLHFNIVNIIISTFVFGLGDDYSIFMMDGLLMEYKDGTKNLPSYKISIFLSALTTLFGIGVLIFAKHPALKSIAVISVIGISCVLLVSYTFIPLLFKTLIGDRVKKGLNPITLFSLVSSFIAIFYFLFGCVLLTIIGFILFKIFQLKNEKTKLIYHYMIMYFTRSLVWGVFFIKKEYLNPFNEDLKTPAVIVANHQSFLDILLFLSAHPKIILFTNNWVWNSPFLGPVVRMAGFFCVDDSVENNLEKIKESVDKGYSIGVFPEGTRSDDLKMKRFHKGAFFLAEQLKMDIIPVVIFGTGYCMPKNDYFVKVGTIAVNILPRIKTLNTDFGYLYQEKTKSIGKYLKDEYEILKKKIETPAYFYNRLLQKYIYKGPVLEWYMRIKVKLEKNYSTMNDLVPMKGKIYDVGCGYGFMTYMLSYLSEERKIIGLDFDEEKINLAAHCNTDTPNVSFYASDALAFNYENADAFVISDVLHYLKKDFQKKLISICVDKLNTGGVLIIRDADNSLKKRHKGTKISEFFSVKLIGFNKSDNKTLSFISSQEMIEIFKSLNLEAKIIDQTKLNSNIIYYIRKPF